MRLKYFQLGDSRDQLKSKYKKLALLHHPDRNIGKEPEATQKMQEINEEMAYCLDYLNGGTTKPPFLEVFDFVNEVLDDMEARSPQIKGMKDFFMEAAISFVIIMVEKNTKIKK